MKNIIKNFTFIMMMATCMNVVAQNEKTTMPKDGVFLRNQTMMVMKQGKIAPMMSEQIMSDGTKIMTDGTIIKANGTSYTLTEGQKADFSGNLTGEKVNTYLYVQNGTVVMETSGMTEPIENDFKLSNGAVLMKDGTILMDGGTQQLKANEKIDFQGNKQPK